MTNCTHPKNMMTKHGKRINKYRIEQIYRCKKCGSKFTQQSKEYRQKIPYEIKKYAIKLVEQNMSLREATRKTMDKYDITFSHHSLLRWLNKLNITLPHSRPASLETRKKISMALSKDVLKC